jgi:hypothetical protein
MKDKIRHRGSLSSPLVFDPVSSERLNAKDFLALSKRNPSAIKSSKVVPPRPGRPGFGGFEVEYTTPMLKMHG